MRSGRGRDDPVGAGDDGLGVEVSGGLVELAGGKAEPGGGAVRLLHQVKGVAEEDGEFVDVGGLEGGEAVGGHADQGGVDGLVLAALGGQGQAGGGGDEQKTGVLVAGVDEGIEASVHERVVDGADGEQAGPVRA